MTLLDRRPAPIVTPLELQVRQMDSVRRFVSRLLDERRGLGSEELTDEDWEALCTFAQGAETERQAVARVVTQADRLRKSALPSTDPIPTLDQHRAIEEFESLARRSQSDMHAEPLILEGSDDSVAVMTLQIPSDFALPTLRDLEQWDRDLYGDPWPVTVEPEDDPEACGVDSDNGVPDEEPSGQSLPEPQARRGLISLLVHPTAAGGPDDEVRRARWYIIFTWIMNTGAIILLFVVWQLWGTSITQHHAQATLKREFVAELHHPVTAPAPGFTLIAASTKVPEPPSGTKMAELEIPKIGLDQVVVSGTATADLSVGPGHYLGTALPGQAGNVAIAGHRTTHGAPFNRLGDLAVGDPIYLTTLAGQRLTYIVSAAPVAVSPSDVTVLNNFGDDRLTLTTCNPPYSAAQRLIVVAAYLPPGAAHPVAIAKGTGKAYRLAPSDATGWNTGVLPLVFIEIASLVALGLGFRRLSRAYGRQGRWLILVPVWAALLLALFESLVNLLPAAV